MATWGRILPELRILTSRSQRQNDSISLWPSASGCVLLAGCHSGCVAVLSLSFLFEFPKDTTRHSRLDAEEQVYCNITSENLCQRVGPDT